MEHPGFFDRAGPFGVTELARRLEAEIGPVGLVELQLEETNHNGLQFLRSLEFEHVDTGQVYVRNA